MVKVRLFRMGATKRPFYRVVATDSRRARNARVLEFLGTYDPRAGTVEVRRDRVQAWVDRGAQLSDTVRSLLRRPVAEAPAVEAAPASGTDA